MAHGKMWMIICGWQNVDGKIRMKNCEWQYADDEILMIARKMNVWCFLTVLHVPGHIIESRPREVQLFFFYWLITKKIQTFLRRYKRIDDFLFWKMITLYENQELKMDCRQEKIGIIVNFSSSGFYHPHIVIRHIFIRIFPSAFYHPHLVIRILPSAFFHPPSAVRRPPSSGPQFTFNLLFVYPEHGL